MHCGDCQGHEVSQGLGSENESDGNNTDNGEHFSRFQGSSGDHRKVRPSHSYYLQRYPGGKLVAEVIIPLIPLACP